MGNASSVKEDGGNHQSELDFEEEENQGLDHMEVAHSYHEHGGPSELMGHQPPPPPPPQFIPTEARMFTPQVPMVPFQRPDNVIIPNHPWQETMAYYEENYEEGIPTMITWIHGGREIYVEGTWDNWSTRKRLQRSGTDFSIMLVLPSGVYQYKFLVDGQWRYAPDLPIVHDDTGNTLNNLDLKDYVPDNLKSLAHFEPPPSPDSSYNNILVEDFSKEPPLAPPHLQMTLLNLPSSSSSATETQSSLPRPPNVVLNHLYMQRGNTGQPVVALGSTHRFQSKYVTVVLYKSVQR